MALMFEKARLDGIMFRKVCAQLKLIEQDSIVVRIPWKSLCVPYPRHECKIALASNPLCGFYSESRVSDRANVGDDIMAQNSSVRAPSLMTTDARPFANENNPSDLRAPLASRRNQLARRFMNAVRWAERRNSAGAVHGNPSTYDSRVFPWVAELESNWTMIRGELGRASCRERVFGYV